MPDNTLLQQTELGKPNVYSDSYDPSRLFPVSRASIRSLLGMTSKLTFNGVDIWNAYEFSWLNTKGKPQIAIAEFVIPADSINLIESKSFKLYLNSFHQTQFDSIADVLNTLQKDLSQLIQCEIQIKLITPEFFEQQKPQNFTGICLDDLDITANNYNYHPDYLRTTANNAMETLYTNLFKSNCPITHQYDWASILIRYEGKKIQHEGLLKYLISYRNHSEFHEQCVERIFMDIMNYCAPEKLTVYARFTRRGGLDINPFRSNFETLADNLRSSRQ